MIIVSDIIDLIFRPRRGIAVINKRGRLDYAFFIVVIAGLLHGTSVFLWGTAPTPLAEHIKRYGLVYIPAITVILWLTLSLGLYFGGRILKTKLPYTKILTILGYIYSISIVTIFVFLPVKLLVWTKIPIQTIAWISSFLNKILLVWLAILTVLGIKELGRISTSKAGVVLAIGLVLHFTIFLCLGIIATILGLALFKRL